MTGLLNYGPAWALALLVLAAVLIALAVRRERRDRARARRARRWWENTAPYIDGFFVEPPIYYFQNPDVPSGIVYDVEADEWNWPNAPEGWMVDPKSEWRIEYPTEGGDE